MDDKLDPAVVGETIRKLRVGANMSQEALARLVGGAGSKVSEWEKGRRLPETVAVYAMAQHFGVTVDYLLTGQERVPGFVAARLRALLAEVEAREGRAVTVAPGEEEPAYPLPATGEEAQRRRA